MKKLISFALIAALLLALYACGTPAPVPNPPLVLGEKYLSDMDYEQALLQFDQAIVIEPQNPCNYLGKADALLHLERQADAASALADGAKAVPREQREAMQIALVEVEKSSVDGYIGLSSAYEKLGWREIAVLLLQRVCEELPEESKLREALEGLHNKAGNTNISNGDEIEIPENVFTYKDFEVLGILKDGMLDIYALAEKCGYSRSEVDASKTASDQWDSYHFDGNGISSMHKLVLWHEWKLNDNELHQASARISYNFPGVILPGDIKIGMTLEEVLDGLYCSAEKKAEVSRAIEEVYADSVVSVYDFDASSIKRSAYFTPKRYDIDGSVSYDAAINYSHTIGNNSYSYKVSFDPNEDTVRYVHIRTAKE